MLFILRAMWDVGGVAREIIARAGRGMLDSAVQTTPRLRTHPSMGGVARGA